MHPSQLFPNSLLAIYEPKHRIIAGVEAKPGFVSALDSVEAPVLAGGGALVGFDPGRYVK
jgi:hypothetical protein